MTTNYKILGQTAPTAGSETLNYAVPNSTSSLVKAINITNTSATADTYSIVTSKNDLFVAVSFNSYQAASSTDGITWTLRTLPASHDWPGLVYGKDTFVAIAAYTTKAATSTNGITWTQRTLPSSVGWTSLTYGNGTFVAVAYGTTTAASSTDGITWTTRTLPDMQLWRSVTYGNGLFVAVSDGSAVAASSTDGITWTTRTLPSGANWFAVAYSSYTENDKYISYNNSIPGNSTVTIKAGYTLATGDGIRVTSTNGTSTFSTFGAEIS